MIWKLTAALLLVTLVAVYRRRRPAWIVRVGRTHAGRHWAQLDHPELVGARHPVFYAETEEDAIRLALKHVPALET